MYALNCFCFVSWLGVHAEKDRHIVKIIIKYRIGLVFVIFFLFIEKAFCEKKGKEVDKDGFLCYNLNVSQV